MNREIIIMRDAIGKLTQMLAGMGLRVTSQGTSAFVEADPIGKPVRVNIPYIPDDASVELIRAIQGFIDHEVAHILFTEFPLKNIAEKEHKFLGQILNAVEDTYIERAIGKKFPGSTRNIKDLHGFFVENVTKPALEEHGHEPMRKLGILLVPLFRAWSGQEAFQEFLTKEGHFDDPMIKEVIRRIPQEVQEQFKTISSTRESLEISRIVLKALELDQMDEEEQESEGEAGEGESDGEGKGKSKKSKKGKGDKSSGKDSSSGSDGSQDEEEDEGASSGDGDGDDEDDDSSGSKKDKTDQGEDGEEDGQGDGDDKSESGDESGDSEEVHLKGKIDHTGKKSSPDGTDGGFPPIRVSFEDVEFEGALEKVISDVTARETRGADYIIYSKDFDEILPYKVKRLDPDHLIALDDKTRHMIAPMQKDIERMMASRSQVIMAPGFRSGRLHSGGLHRLAAGDDRVFRRKQESRSKETAVSLLIDNSGSMSGEPMRTAMMAGYALSQTLERVGIPHECIGFTTQSWYYYGGNAPKEFDRYKVSAEEKKMGRAYSRLDPLSMPIYKGFDERLTPPVKQRFAEAAMRQEGLMNNVDGEAVQIATLRLLQRSEKRKVLLVLSDGFPAAHGVRDELMSNLHRAVADGTKAGVEIVGIGIMTDAVQTFYPRSFVLRDIETLPGLVMGELKRILAS